MADSGLHGADLVSQHVGVEHSNHSNDGADRASCSSASEVNVEIGACLRHSMDRDFAKLFIHLAAIEKLCVYKRHKQLPLWMGVLEFIHRAPACRKKRLKGVASGRASRVKLRQI